MASFNLDINLNLPETPKGVPPEIDGEIRRIYNAIRALGRYVQETVNVAIAAATPVRGSVVMSGGVGVVVDTTVGAGTRVFCTVQGLGTVAVAKAVHVIVTAGVGFSIVSADNTDTSHVAWMYYK